MTHIDTPPTDGTPSSSKLLRSTAIAAVVATVLVVTIVLPAEYGVDPTGAGRVLGLKQMGEIKMTLAREAAGEVVGVDSVNQGAAVGSAAPVAAASPVPAAPATPEAGTNARVTTITLKPTQGREIKLTMKKGASVNYSWSTDRGVVNYDTHGDPPNPPRGFYHGYGKASGKASDEGVLVAAFDGMHGWFWRNRGREPLTVTLRVDGDYQELKEIK